MVKMMQEYKHLYWVFLVSMSVSSIIVDIGINIIIFIVGILII